MSRPRAHTTRRPGGKSHRPVVDASFRGERGVTLLLARLRTGCRPEGHPEGGAAVHRPELKDVHLVVVGGWWFVVGEQADLRVVLVDARPRRGEARAGLKY